MTYHIIYKTTNIVNDKYYYGVHSTENLEDGYVGSGYGLKNAIKKYGINNFKKEIIAFFDDREQALLYESKIVNKELVENPMCYNSTIGGGSPPSRLGKISPSTLLKGENRTEKQKQAATIHSERMKENTPWNKGLKGVQKAWNKNVPNERMKQIASIERKCPHCDKIGKGSSMLRWHFNNCRNGM